MTGIRTPRAVAFTRWAGACALVLVGGCKSSLDVENPNNVSADALNVPAAAGAIVAGAENIAANGLSSLYNATVPATDEAYWVGSRDDYRLLDTGGYTAVANEYVQSGFIIMAKARWMANQAIDRLSAFNTNGDLLDRSLLARAYLNAAVVYTAIGDNFNDFAFSDRTEAGPNLGEANMVQVYDSALKWLDAGLALPNQTAAMKTNLTGMRARVRHAKAVWQKLTPKGTTPANPLVSDAAMLADATAALAGMSGDYRYDAVTNDLNQGDGSGGGFGFEMNSRVEYTPNKDLADIDPNSGKPKSIIAKDPVTNAVDAAAVKVMGRVIAALNMPPLTQFSEREMRLIIAEHQLASGNNAGFDTAINGLRAMDGKAAYTGAGPTRIQLLQWERRINLIFQSRRLSDMYRFGVKDPLWLATNIAVRKPGCKFPIPQIELDSNKKITGTTACT